MKEEVNELVEVLASFKHGPRNTVRVIPHLVNWGGKRYRLEKVGLYHPERRGSKLFHVFSFSSGSTAFRLELNPDTLEWMLTEVFYE